MGIRINKALGWILQDETLDLSALENITLLDLKKEFPLDEELIYIDLMSSEIDLNQTLNNFVTHVNEEGDSSKDVFIFYPPLMKKEWKRHDNSIDYHEWDNISAETKIKLLHGGLFPFSQPFVVTKSLTTLTSLQQDRCLILSNSVSQLSEPLRQELSATGLDLSLPLKPQIHMLCPRIIQLILAKCSSVDYRRLQPAIVSYWA